MLTILLTMIAAGILGYFLQDSWDRSVGVALMFTVVGFVLGILIAGVVGEFCKTKTEVSLDQVPIVSLRDHSGVSGSFFLGCGQIQDKTYYVFYEDMGNNRYKQRKVSTEDTVIIEDGNKFYSKATKTFVNEKNFLWALPLSVVDNELHVPKGTIVKEITLR